MNKKRKEARRNRHTTSPSSKPCAHVEQQQKLPEQEEQEVRDGDAGRDEGRERGWSRRRCLPEVGELSLGPRRTYVASVREQTKKTQYSPREDALLFASLRHFCSAHGLGNGDDAVYDFIESKRWKQHRGCWNEIARALPDRSIQSVMERAMRTFNKKEKKGAWNDEEATLLLELYRKHGNNFKQIGAELNRWSVSVRDKVRVLLSEEGQKMHTSGPGRWSPHEDRQLIKLVKEASNNFEIKIPTGGSFWVEVAKRMEGRNYSQCRMRWSRVLDPNAEKVVGWTPGENWLLIQNLAQGGYVYREDIRWPDICSGLPFSHTAIAAQFTGLMAKHHIDSHAPLDEILEELAGPIKQEYDKWVDEGMPTQLTKYQKAVERTRQHLKELCHGSPHNGDKADDEVTESPTDSPESSQQSNPAAEEQGRKYRKRKLNTRTQEKTKRKAQKKRKLN